MTGTTGRWSVDPERSTVAFEVKHLGLATVKGSFREFEGTLDLAEGRASGFAAVASVDSGDEGRNGFLTSAEFFDAAAFPRIAFEADEAGRRDDGSLEVTGRLTMHGVTRPLTLTGTIVADGDRAALELSGRLDRTEFGLRFAQAMGTSNALVSDTVQLRLSLSATRRG
jgi:polyisoprenoid-binding protein YceI